MTDITLTTTDLELVTITLNAVLLLSMGLAMVFAKRLEKIGAKLLDMRPSSLFRHAGALSFHAVSFHGHS